MVRRSCSVIADLRTHLLLLCSAIPSSSQVRLDGQGIGNAHVSKGDEAASVLRVYKRKSLKCARNKHFTNVLPNGERPKTAYCKSYGNVPLDKPPRHPLLKKDREIGDIHMHWTDSSRQFWIYLGGDGKASWQPIELGYKRELDGRYLSLTKKGNPNFVGDDWAQRAINDTMKKGV